MEDATGMDHLRKVILKQQNHAKKEVLLSPNAAKRELSRPKEI